MSESERLQRIWLSKRDACVHCQAYAGTVANEGHNFPGGLTWGEEPICVSDIPGPPLHNGCRCHEERIDGGEHAMSDALKREAMRSIAKGWSLPSEDLNTRLKATQKLLDSNPSLPKSVIAEAKRAVRLGAFKSRIVPGKDTPPSK